MSIIRHAHGSCAVASSCEQLRHVSRTRCAGQKTWPRHAAHGLAMGHVSENNVISLFTTAEMLITGLLESSQPRSDGVRRVTFAGDSPQRQACNPYSATGAQT
jgi:hypothetical protein